MWMSEGDMAKASHRHTRAPRGQARVVTEGRQACRGWGGPNQPACARCHAQEVTDDAAAYGYREVTLSSEVELPEELDTARLRRRAALVAGLLVVVALVAWLAPGLGEVRDRLQGASAGWLALAVVFEVLSCVSYVVMFRPVFCGRMSPRTSTELALSELAVGSIVPAAGTAGLALGVWALRRGGMPAEKIATRTVAFFVLKSAANFVAVAVIGTLLAVGLVGPDLSLGLTAAPAALAVATIAAVVAVPRVADRPGVGRGIVARVARSLADGVREAMAIVRRRDAKAVGGSFGYWAFDNAVLWACFAALGDAPALSIILMGYLLGQLGGLLPLPGGLGGVDGGLIGVLIVFGAPAAMTVAAVLAYRLILFWVPLLIGGVAFASLRRALNRPDRPDLCNAVATPA
jgi:uncharacterized membrane protein YbhN (UPF0104 family)